MYSYSIRQKAILLATSAMLMGSVPALAQDQAATPAPTAAEEPAEVQHGDIIVTATRRSESVLNVPISITAMSQESLDTKGIKNIADLGRITPGLAFTPSWGGSTRISIRGISSGIGAGTTGIYIDDTPVQVRFVGASAVSTNVYPQIFDLDRVEVLRGPQGTLFGSGSEGGTVRFITPEPGLTNYTGYARTELAFTKGGAPSYEAGAAVGGPIVEDKIGFRVSGFYRRDGGYVDRVDFATGQVRAKDSNSNRSLVLRGALTFAPTERLKITPSIFYQKLNRDDTSQYFPMLSDPSSGQFRNGLPIAQIGEDKMTLYAVKGEYDLGAVSLFSSTSFLDRDNPSVGDYSHYVAELLGSDYEIPLLAHINTPTFNRQTQKSFTQEVRLQSNDPNARLRWVLGAFYQNARQSSTQRVVTDQYNALSQALFGVDFVDALGMPPLPGNVTFAASDGARDRQIAAFGQVDFQLTNTLTLTAGARYAKTKFNFTNSQDGPFNSGPTGSSGRQSETPFTPKFGVNYKPNANLMLYATAAKGFRTGGANAPVPAVRCQTDLSNLGLSQAPTQYGSDSVWSYEVGAKGRPAGRLIEFEGSAFYINWTKIQSSVELLSCGFNYVANLGKAVSKGFDLRATIHPARGLTLEVSTAYTDAKYKQTVLGGTVAGGMPGIIVAAGTPLNVAPWHVSLAGDYEFALNDKRGSTSYIHADYDFNSGFTLSPFANIISYDPLTRRVDANHFVSARAGIRTGGVDVSLFVQNLLNSTDILQKTHDTTASTLLRLSTYRPRTIGITASFRR